MSKCKCTQHDLDDGYESIEISQIVHSADFCGGKHAYELHLKDKRIAELTAGLEAAEIACGFALCNKHFTHTRSDVKDMRTEIRAVLAKKDDTT